jgi:GNAT superfamily N-acetyltransferase
MSVSVRDFRPEDAEAVARVRHASIPYLVTTGESVLFATENAHPAQKYRLLVAESGGEVIGAAHVSLAHESREPGQGTVTPHIHPGHRGRGAGSLLLRTAEQHLAAEGATRVYAWVTDEPRERAFAERHGYAPRRPARFLRLDLVGGPLPDPAGLKPLAAGFELCTAADFAADPRPLFETDAEVSADEPGDISAELGDYQDWLRQTWNHPCLDRDLTSVVVAPDGRIAAFTAAHSDRATRYVTGMTGTLRDFRGQGFAKLVKTDSLRRARAAGHTEAFTSNDAGNAPMLAVNRWFGYEICGTEVRHVRQLPTARNEP